MFGLLAQDDTFKFENQIAVITFTLDKYIDKVCESLAEQAYCHFLKRNKSEDFNFTVSLLLQKQGYYNVQAVNSHNHLMKRMKLLIKITEQMKGGILTPEQSA